MNNDEGEDARTDNDNAIGNDPFSTVDIAQVAVHSANAGVWIIDTATQNFLSSARTKELFGFLPEEEMSLEAAMSQIVEKHRKTVLKAMDNAFKTRSNLYIEYPVVGYHDQQHRWLNVTAGFSESDASNTYFSGIVMDITDQKQNDLRRSKFIGMVSHELKTPLTALKAYVQMLNNWAKKQKDNFTIGALSKVDKQVRKMLNMINSLLNLSGAETGKIHLNKQNFTLNELISEVIEETLFITSSHHIVMLPSELINVNADREKIEQVLVNLLSNAAKYSDKTAPIEIGCTRIDDTVTVSIRDEGLGIAQDDIAKLFLPHYRVESKETEKISGFGIGLYLCAEIIQRHQGEIWVESELGKGSTFKFTLPGC
ncbi:PAS domain-containing sensor histidine kinase [Mucilaginibacter gilvus]|uniref:histidine kinase n=1 Tax=Mucilaginibacter gilvus TaxID=2305909 RepID=A0A444MQM9_9SPHI|nr:PAS domain-containing sensor histidine kinase [Mucilaginibacter gilvus]RWY53919.1 PAS domain-containing sensor histidine kinase [Mucilaginibacter gilvus]